MKMPRSHPDIGIRATTAALLFAVVASAGTAAAGGYADRVHADSYGNLIIHGSAGYKRIVVGQGHLAEELAAYSRAGEPKVVYLDPSTGEAVAPRCRSQGVLLRGRSYMYGLPDNVVPVLEHPCR